MVHNMGFSLVPSEKFKSQEAKSLSVRKNGEKIALELEVGRQF